MKVKDVLLADVAKRSAVSVVTVNFLLNRELKQRRRRQQRERQKSNRFRLAKQHVHQAFLYIFFAVAAGLQCESAYEDKDFLFLFLNFDTVL